MIRYYNLFISFVYLVGDVWTPSSGVYKHVPWPQDADEVELIQRTLATSKGVSMDNFVILNIIKLIEVD